MAKHNETGQLGEEMAAEFLRERGFEILERNWRFGRSEVDIIAKEGEVLVFVEVKTRSTDYFGRPEEFVSKSKERHLAKIAAAYMHQINYEWKIRFDVVAVQKTKGNNWKIKLLRDAFFPGLESQD